MSISRTGSSNTAQACAACKYQRRKCASDCILAPYFPHDRQRQFQNAHKLFGVSNIKKIIKNLNPPDKDISMRTIVFQSDARANDPVGGCYMIIQELQRQIEYNQAELDLVYHQLAICRAQAAQQQPPQQHHNDLTLGCDIINPRDPLNSYNSNYYYVQEPHDDLFTVDNDEDDNQHQQQHQLHEKYDNSWDIHESTTALSTLNIKQSFIKQCDNEVVHDDNNDDDGVKHGYGIPCERHNEMKFEKEDIVERRFVPSTQLVMSS
ncbi:mediator of RNA polymerase II transcription subunit 9-like [Hibiscus syriacus]|uniref:Mediator of RNA polymerase II transcription subunit 9-like n=1 Tax=Hibiscus syriacus TaxID=106335 RepID=A0A6A3BTP5_HIBSY|nr:LOB domain-containing protein 22-like [Hibiscus syriacus]KAE8720063.1 mediator of RNA polymerase II transcription subunit 9-like [Hibiscus syriacus]